MAQTTVRTDILQSLDVPADNTLQFTLDALIYVVVFVSILAMIFITSPEGILISLIISFIFLGILNIWTNTTLFGKTSSITWLVVAIGIVLYKLVQRRREGM